MKWQTGKELGESIERSIFELQVNRFAWKKVLSIKPRRCFWTGARIQPFSYAMIAYYNERRLRGTVHDHSDDYPTRWVSMSAYVHLRLLGKI